MSRVFISVLPSLAGGRELLYEPEISPVVTDKQL